MRDMEHQRQIIDIFVNSVYVFDDRVVLNFNFTDDSKTISREEVLGSSAVDNAPPHPRPFGLGIFLSFASRNCKPRISLLSGVFFPWRVWYTRLSATNRNWEARIMWNELGISSGTTIII